MSKFLGSLTLIAVLALSSGAFACGMGKSVSGDSKPVATATTQPSSDGTTASKTTETKTGG
jgi:hypothetical protein